MSENLTHPSDAAVGAFLDAVEHPVRRRDGWRVHDLLVRLGPHRASKACVYVTNLDRVDVDVLEEMLRASYATVRRRVMDHHAEG